MAKLNQWLYIYYISEDGEHVIYDRTMHRSAVYFAKKRVEELEKRGKEAFYTIGTVLPRSLY